MWNRRFLGVLASVSALVAPLGCRGRESKPATRSESPVPSPAGKPRPVQGSGGVRSATLEQLRSGAEADRRQALRELRYSTRSQLEAWAGPLVDSLRGIVRNEDDPLRMAAVDTIGWLAQPPNDGYQPYQKTSVWPALPDLAAIASDAGQDEQLRAHAIDAMQFLDPEHGAPTLAGVLLDPQATLQLRLLAARALQWSLAGRAQLRAAVEGQGLPDLVRGAAVDAVCASRTRECAALTGQPDPEVRLQAASSLAGDGGEQPLAELRSALHDPARRAQAIPAIEALGGRGAALMIEALESPDPDLRLIAIRSLGGRLRDAAKPAIPALRRVEQDPAASDLLKTAAAQALREIGPPVSEIAAGLDGSPEARQRALGGLWMAVRSMGEHGADLIPHLRKPLKDSDPRVRARAASILGDFRIPREQASWKAAAPDSALAVFRAAARDAMPDLIAALRDPDSTVRRHAAHAFQVLLRSQEVGAPGDEPLQALAAALRDDTDPSVRSAALMALGEVAFDHRLAAEDTDEARLVMSAIRGAARDPSPDVSSRSAYWVNYAQAAIRLAEGR